MTELVYIALDFDPCCMEGFDIEVRWSVFKGHVHCILTGACIHVFASMN